MDGEGRDDAGRPQQTPPAGYIYEFGTWRLIPAGSARRTIAQGRAPKKKGG
ncbi:MAG TPA: hypothetical protein VD969_11145 [Symbiobacteriaceae bacterium]|nr:hypothetical protein [Symbiobacteriaceae bacterium]